MPRKASTEAEITAQLATAAPTRLTKGQYNELSAQMKKESLSNEIGMQMQILNTIYDRGKVNLQNSEEIRGQTMAFFTACKTTGTPPTFEKLCSSFGLSRQDVYKFMREHSETETARFLKCVQYSIASIIESQGLQRNFSEAVSIFLLKNSGIGMQDSVMFQPSDDMSNDQKMTAGEIMERYKDLPD